MADPDTLEADLMAALSADAHGPFTSSAAAIQASHGLPSFSPSFLAQSDRPPTAPYLPTLQSPIASENSQQTAGAKRAMESDPREEESDAKRRKASEDAAQGVKAEPEDRAPELDLNAMLKNALAGAGFDEHPCQPNEVRHEAAITAPEPVRARSPTVTPGPEKVEDRIMKSSSKSTHMARFMSLQPLGNYAVQILLRLSQQSRFETELLLTDHESDFWKDYQTLIQAFVTAKNIFSSSPLFFPEDLGFSDSDDCETIRMSNLTTVAVSTFGANDVSLVDIEKAFFTIFVSEESGYTASSTDLLINLKTQVLIDELNDVEESQHVNLVLDKLFPADFGEWLKRRTAEGGLNSDEEQLVKRMEERREHILSSGGDGLLRSRRPSQLTPGEGNQLTLQGHLRARYSPNQFAEDLSTFLRSHLSMVVEFADRVGVNIPLSQRDTAVSQNHTREDDHFELASFLQAANPDLAQNEMLKDPENLLAGMPSSFESELGLSKLIEQSLSAHKLDSVGELPDRAVPSDVPESSDAKDIDLASLIAKKLLEAEIPPNGFPNVAAPYTNGANNVSHGTNPQQRRPGARSPMSTANHAQFRGPQPNQLPSAAYQPYASQAPAAAQPTGANGDQLPPNQSSPTSVLYERARQAAVAKNNSNTRREGIHSTRRPWTPEEERALMAGLDMVKGPHWSQILSLFGANGSISDILKERTQVQLKDKARNLKLFFLKTNSEMPYYLQSVTGELKTRAPSQAARKEAEEKARLNLEEDQARIQGIMTLAGGLQNNHHHAAHTPLAASPSTRASPATPALGQPNAGMYSAPSHVPQSQAKPPGPPVTISPVVKSERPEHHPHHQTNKLAQIQPAPAPTSAVGQVPIAPMQAPLKPQLPASQNHHPTASHVQSIHQPLLGTPPLRAQAHTQQQHQHQHQQSQAAPTNQQPYSLPPIPPNHHSTPDHAQDAKLFEILSASLAGASESPPVG